MLEPSLEFRGGIGREILYEGSEGEEASQNGGGESWDGRRNDSWVVPRSLPETGGWDRESADNSIAWPWVATPGDFLPSKSYYTNYFVPSGRLFLYYGYHSKTTESVRRWHARQLRC